MPDVARVDPDFDQLDALKFVDEDAAIAALLAAPPLDAVERRSVEAKARQIVRQARALKRRKGMMESFLEEFGLSNAEGLALMCLAEALLRVPDAGTADRLIAEKIRSGRWEDHLGKADSWLVNAGTFGLMLTGRLAAAGEELRRDFSGFMGRFVARAGEPVVRAAAMQAMRILGEQFVLGRTIEAAIQRGKGMIRSGAASHFSFDMLGEGARTAADAERYFQSYRHALEAVGADGAGLGPLASSGLSVKLSALHPRYEARCEARVFAELYPKVRSLAVQAREYNVGFCIDAEEADRLALSLKLLARLAQEPDLGGWEGLGLAVQAYQKRARTTVSMVAAIARGSGRRLMMRLVKGAYWDGEIKRAQVQGRPDYPVWTTKAATDVNYLACARDMLDAEDALYCQFATHNAFTAAAIAHMAAQRGVRAYEFQRLHGMGEPLYAVEELGAPVRVYAPVGGHEDLLPYLVRRLLENGANTSFVHAFLDDDVAPEEVAADPLARLEACPKPHPRLSKPPHIYGPSRRNSEGVDLSVAAERARLSAAGEAWRTAPVAAASLTGAAFAPQPPAPRHAPGDRARLIGSASEATPELVALAAAQAHAAQPGWNRLGGPARAAILRAMGDGLEREKARFVALLALEGGRTLQDGVDEVREAVDFCRYYAAEAERLFAGPAPLTGPVGETNTLELAGRGVFACISPWNFPLAIFLGQIAAALAAGNTVVAKPAEQTPLTAFEAVKLFQACGLPAGVLHLVLGGAEVGRALTADPRIAGVAFTGSTETAWAINRALAARDGPIATLIAETGGLNGLFVDTTALKEQVVDDAILSAFGSAGQRCSALRVAFLPHETADALLETLVGALNDLCIGDPLDPRTDIGPVIDADAAAMLHAHLQEMHAKAKVVAARTPPPGLDGFYFGPAIVELPSLDLLTREIFGPILHVVRYHPAEVGAIGQALAQKGFGLTLGVHSRLEGFAREVLAAVPAGNCYVNRSMIGAVVGVQPFGGQGLSGNGPKAGGPHYLARFATERTVSINITAQGGDPSLLNL